MLAETKQAATWMEYLEYIYLAVAHASWCNFEDTGPTQNYSNFLQTHWRMDEPYTLWAVPEG